MSGTSVGLNINFNYILLVETFLDPGIVLGQCLQFALNTPFNSASSRKGLSISTSV